MLLSSPLSKLVVEYHALIVIQYTMAEHDHEGRSRIMLASTDLQLLILVRKDIPDALASL